MYFIWFLLCSTMAKHLPVTETSIENQRASSSSSFHSTSYSQPVPTETINSLLASSHLSPFHNSHTSSTYPPLFDSGGIDKNWKTERSGIPSNGTQSNETSSDDSQSLKEEILSRDVVDREGGLVGVSQGSDSTPVDSNSIQKMITVLEKNEAVNETRSLKRVFLTNRSIVCNDGSQAGFYLRRSPTGSNVWVVFLEGGWYCFDRQSCRGRWLRLRHLMTSSQWPETRDVNGILSANPAENPYWHNANHVSVPYCSSDTWSGTAPLGSTKDSFHFMGKLIVNQVIRDLVPLGLQNSSQLLLAGSSAGGTGVMLNLDPVQHLLHVELQLKHISVRGISDSGWFLDRTPYSPNGLPAVDAIKKGHALWQGSLPKRCVDLYPQEPWRCYFGYRLYPTIRAPLFVFQWLFDEAQMTADNVGAPVTPQQWDYVHHMGHALRASLAGVTAVFAPSCVSHSVLTKRDWLKVTVDDVSVARALRCWELATQRRPARNNSSLLGAGALGARQLVRAGGARAAEAPPRPGGPRRRRRKKHRRVENQPQNNRNNGSDHQLKVNQRMGNRQQSGQQHPRKKQKMTPNQRRIATNSSERIRGEGARRKHGNRRKTNVVYNCSGEDKKEFNLRAQPNTRRKGPLKCGRSQGRRHDRRRNEEGRRFAQNEGPRFSKNATVEGILPSIFSAVSEGDRIFGYSEAEDQVLAKPVRPQRSLIRGFKSGDPGCEHRHIERCSWPQCNHSCPRLLDPYTGEEVHFMDMLKSFGLQMESVAQALGVDMHTLNNMEHAELLNLLTQQIN